MTIFLSFYVGPYFIHEEQLIWMNWLVTYRESKINCIVSLSSFHNNVNIQIHAKTEESNGAMGLASSIDVYLVIHHLKLFQLAQFAANFSPLLLTILTHFAWRNFANIPCQLHLFCFLFSLSLCRFWFGILLPFYMAFLYHTICKG